MRAVGVLSGISHRQGTRLNVLKLEVLVLELLAIDRLAAGTVTLGEVATLKHELDGDRGVKNLTRHAIVAMGLTLGMMRWNEEPW